MASSGAEKLGQLRKGREQPMEGVVFSVPSTLSIPQAGVPGAQGAGCWHLQTQTPCRRLPSWAPQVCETQVG